MRLPPERPDRELLASLHVFRPWLVKTPGRVVSVSTLVQALRLATMAGMPARNVCIASADANCEIGPEQIRRLVSRGEETRVRPPVVWDPY